VFPLFAGLYFWFPKLDRPHAERAPRRMEFLGTVHRVQPDVLSHALPGARRHATSHLYVLLKGWVGNTLNLIATVGAFLIALSVLMALINMILSARNGPVAGANPGRTDAEWATPSPPPAYNFAHIPLVSGDNPLWEHRERLAGDARLATR